VLQITKVNLGARKVFELDYIRAVHANLLDCSVVLADSAIQVLEVNHVFVFPKHLHSPHPWLGNWLAIGSFLPD
jgi:hypothetical protein